MLIERNIDKMKFIGRKIALQRFDNDKLKYFHSVVKKWHKNVVNVVGSYVSLCHVFVVEEFCDCGSLEKYIKMRKSHFVEV